MNLRPTGHKHDALANRANKLSLSLLINYYALNIHALPYTKHIHNKLNLIDFSRYKAKICSSVVSFDHLTCKFHHLLVCLSVNDRRGRYLDR